MLDIYDYVALMDYRDHAEGPDGIVSHAMEEMKYAKWHHKKLVISVELSPNEIQKVSFSQLAEADLERELALTNKAFHRSPAFAGFAIPHFTAYPLWLRREQPQESIGHIEP